MHSPVFANIQLQIACHEESWEKVEKVCYCVLEAVNWKTFLMLLYMTFLNDFEFNVQLNGKSFRAFKSDNQQIKLN